MDQTGSFNLKVFSVVSGLACKRERKSVVESCGLETIIHKNLQCYEEDDLHRLNFAQALLGNPEIILVDDIFKGKSDQFVHDFMKLISDTCKDKSLLIFSTNERILRDLCHDVIYI